MIRPLVIALFACAFGALPLAAAATTTGAATSSMPSCLPSDPVVWVNTKSNVYHVSGDKYFGATKSGRYVCRSKAVSMGARASGAGRTASSGPAGSTGSAAPDDDAAAATPAPSSAKHKRHHADMSTPAP